MEPECSTGIILKTVNKDGAYYWVKLPTSFFDSQDVRMIENMDNGDRYVVFWLKLLLLAVQQDEIGILRYKPDIPYDVDILAAVTNTDVDIVRSAMGIFSKVGLIQIMENNDIWIEAIHRMVGSITDAAIRMRKLRERRKKEIEDKTEHSEQCYVEKSREELEIEKEIDIDVPNGTVTNVTSQDVINNFSPKKLKWFESLSIENKEKYIGDIIKSLSESTNA